MNFMKKSILVTAVSGTGKSTVFKELITLGYTAYDIEENDNLFTMFNKETGKVVGAHNNDDLEVIKQNLWNCDRNKMQKLINNEKSQLAFYCGAGSNLDEIYDLFDKVIVLQVSDETTIKRLKNRKPGEFGNTIDTQKWILSWKHKSEKTCIEKGGIPINAEASPGEVAEKVINIATI